MAISMNDHENRITTLESKIGSGGGITESSFTSPGFIKFSNGFTINWGFAAKASNGTVRTHTFKKAFSNACLAVTLSPDIGTYNQTYTCMMSTNLTSSTFQTKHFDNFGAWWIAIGY